MAAIEKKIKRQVVRERRHVHIFWTYIYVERDIFCLEVVLEVYQLALLGVSTNPPRRVS